MQVTDRGVGLSKLRDALLATFMEGGDLSEQVLEHWGRFEEGDER
jgi:hypothetical protein